MNVAVAISQFLSLTVAGARVPPCLSDAMNLFLVVKSGFIIDQTGNYDLPFYIYGALMAPPAIVFMFLTCLFPSLRKTPPPATSTAEEAPASVPPRTRKETVNDMIMRSTTSLAIQH